jgi:hypothetical protein
MLEVQLRVARWLEGSGVTRDGRRRRGVSHADVIKAALWPTRWASAWTITGGWRSARLDQHHRRGAWGLKVHTRERGGVMSK